MSAVLAACAAVVLAGGLAALGWLIREQISHGKALALIGAQYKNNGGATIRDAVDRIEAKVDDAGSKLNDHLVVAAVDHEILRQHIASSEQQ